MVEAAMTHIKYDTSMTRAYHRIAEKGGRGRLYPVLLDKHGNVIDGMHRLAADENRPKMRLDHV